MELNNGGKASYMYQNFATFSALFHEKACKITAFFELTKYFGKNLLFYLLFYLKWERTDEISVAEEVNRVKSCYDILHRPVASTVVLVSRVFDLAGEGIRHLAALEGEDVLLGLAQQVAVRVDDTDIQVFETGCTGDVFRNGVVKLQFADVTAYVCLLVLLVRCINEMKMELF